MRPRRYASGELLNLSEPGLSRIGSENTMLISRNIARDRGESAVVAILIRFEQNQWVFGLFLLCYFEMNEVT
jgi:hypothetical protein